MNEAIELHGQRDNLSASQVSTVTPISRKDMLLAALPCLLISFSGLITLFHGFGWLQYETPLSQAINTSFTIVLALIAISLLIYAWRTGWPRWSAAWMALWLIGLIFLATGLPTTVWEPEQFFYTYLQPLLWGSSVLILAYFLYRIFRVDAFTGLLAALPVMGIVWTPLNEFVPDILEGVITTTTWLLLAVGAVIVLRTRSSALALGVTLGAVAIFGLPHAYEAIYKGGALNFDAPGPSPLQVIRIYLPYLVSASTLVIGPSFARFYYHLGLHGGPAGRKVYRLALLGLLLMLVANITTYLVQTSDALRIAWHSSTLILNSLNGLGILLFIGGFIWLLAIAHQRRVLPNAGLMSSLFLLSLLLPGILLITLRYGYIWPEQLSIYDVGYLYSYPEYLVYGFGLAWMILSSWLVAFLNTRKFVFSG